MTTTHLPSAFRIIKSASRGLLPQSFTFTAQTRKADTRRKGEIGLGSGPVPTALAHPRSPECEEKEERRLVAFKKKMYSKWKRPFPMLKKRLPTCLELRSWRHRKLAVRWHLGNFPRHYPYLRKIGLQGLLDELKVLSCSKASSGVNIIKKG